MNLKFIRKLPVPQEIKQMYPLNEELQAVKDKNDKEIRDVFLGNSDKFILIIGPCSADREDAVIEYIKRLRTVQDKVADKIVIIPRIYTNKPRTTGAGYKGMLHQPDPHAEPNMLKGLISIRKLHLKALQETGFSCADEMLYSENHRYLSDLLSYVAVGARSVEDQQHRLTASGLNIPVGMKNPTGGDISVMLNSVNAAQHSHTFIYRGWECKSEGNPLTHCILRGYVDTMGVAHPNYSYENLVELNEIYTREHFQNPSVIIDTNHSNSGKNYMKQIDIAMEVLEYRKRDDQIKKLVKGLMIESYLVDGNQKISDNQVYGQSITDPCLGWEKTEELINDIYKML
ncbi:MAG: 3-deoxy-7-phosphoheptulonate synthase [Bacilli bacterium]|nr:3-deoxy-7-phosphoheptulonate synthase [Bacilli bacterium]